MTKLPVQADVVILHLSISHMDLVWDIFLRNVLMALIPLIYHCYSNIGNKAHYPTY